VLGAQIAVTVDQPTSARAEQSRMPCDERKLQGYQLLDAIPVQAQVGCAQVTTILQGALAQPCHVPGRGQRFGRGMIEESGQPRAEPLEVRRPDESLGDSVIEHAPGG
jgi:hypothetical protein